MQTALVRPRFAPLGLYLVWLACVLVADWRSPVAWSGKFWGVEPNTPGLVETIAMTALLTILLALPSVAWPWIWRGVAVTACGLAGWSFWLWLNDPHWRASGPTDNAEQFGIVCAVLAICALRVNAWAVAVLCVWLVMLTQARGAELGLVMAGLVLLGWKRGLTVGALAGLSALVLRHDASTLGPRWRLLVRGVESVWYQPLGWGHVGWMWTDVQTTESGIVWSVNMLVHSAPLDWAIVGGVPGAGVLCGLLGWALWRLRKRPLMLASGLAYCVSMMTLYETWMTGALLVLLVASAFAEPEPEAVA